MNHELQIKVIRPDELGPAELGLWSEFRASRPDLASPYFDYRYASAAGEASPDAKIAVMKRGGRVVGFMPFQRRGGLVQPLGAPLTDYCGVIARADEVIDPTEVVRLLGAQRFRFAGLHASQPFHARLPKHAVVMAHAMVADLSGGFEAWEAGRKAAGKGRFLKDKRRRLSLLEQDVGPVEFTLDRGGEEVLDFILRLKREQMTSAGQHDVFACGWTETLLRRLLAVDAPDFGARIATLRAGGKIVAAEIGLRSGCAYHLWFPVYDPALAKYSPGQLMTLETLRAASLQGITRVDFGAGGEAYKSDFAEPAEAVFEGSIVTNPTRAVLSKAPGLRRERIRLDRRLDRILACETDLSGRTRAFAQYAGVVVRRRPFVAIGLGLGLAASLTLIAE